MDHKINNRPLPHISSVTPRSETRKESPKEKINSDEFLRILEQEKGYKGHDEVKLSQHAARRLGERNMTIDGDEYLKIKDAVSQIKQKGGKDSLIITRQGAYIVDVKNNTIVTAMTRGNISENVFTNIDSTILIDS